MQINAPTPPLVYAVTGGEDHIMITFQDAPAHVLAIRLSGTVTRQDILTIEDRLGSAMADHDRLGLVADLSGMTDLTAGAVAEDVRYELSLLPRLGRFPKIAVISDKAWIGRLVRLFDPLFPGNDMRVFAPGAEADALAFAAELGDPKLPPAGDVIALDSGRDDLIAYEVRGHLTAAAMEEMAPRMLEAFGRPGKVDLLLKITDYEGFSPEILMQRSTFSMKFAAFGNVRRYAIVGAKPWMKKIVHLFAPISPMDIRAFSSEDEDAAWAWVNEGAT